MAVVSSYTQKALLDWLLREGPMTCTVAAYGSTQLYGGGAGGGGRLLGPGELRDLVLPVVPPTPDPPAATEPEKPPGFRFPELDLD